jgi:geranylgeranyl pyrophosphate synthase
MQPAGVNARSLVSTNIFQEVADYLRGLLAGTECPQALRDLVISQLSGKGRLLPEGTFSPWPFLPLITYQTASGEEPRAAVPAAASIEMMVACADLIDDLQDGEADLSGRQAVSEAFEVVWMLHYLSQKALLECQCRGIPERRLLNAARRVDGWAIRAMSGQHRDIASEALEGVAVEESLQMSLLKSASLTRCAAEVGASLATDDEEVIRSYGEFGMHLGMVGQLMNDIAAVWPGGPNKSDLRLGKMTPPITAGLRAARAGHPDGVRVSKFIERVACEEAISDKDVEEVKWALWECGAIREVWTAAAIERAAGQRTVRELASKVPEAATLVHLID